MIFRPFTRRPRPTVRVAYAEADARTFRRLVREARRMARAPTSDTEAFWRAAERAIKAILPPGHVRRDSIFVQLIAKGRVWWRLTPLQRQAEAGNLALLCDACDAALDPPDSPTRPPRLDIFG